MLSSVFLIYSILLKYTKFVHLVFFLCITMFWLGEYNYRYMHSHFIFHKYTILRNPWNLVLYFWHLQWNTCKLQLPAGALLCAFDGMVTSLHKNHRTSAALPIASAMLARVMALTGTSVLEKRGQPVYKQLMFVEAARRQTFSTWPHSDYKYVLQLDVSFVSESI